MFLRDGLQRLVKVFFRVISSAGKRLYKEQLGEGDAWQFRKVGIFEWGIVDPRRDASQDLMAY
jgi:hypothetical protein